MRKISKEDRAARISMLEASERKLMEANNNGRLDTILYNLRVELDTLRILAKKRP